MHINREPLIKLPSIVILTISNTSLLPLYWGDPICHQLIARSLRLGTHPPCSLLSEHNCIPRELPPDRLVRVIPYINHQTFGGERNKAVPPLGKVETELKLDVADNHSF